MIRCGNCKDGGFQLMPGTVVNQHMSSRLSWRTYCVVRRPFCYMFLLNDWRPRLLLILASRLIYAFWLWTKRIAFLSGGTISARLTEISGSFGQHIPLCGSSP